ncbi:MAG: hypothetical protein ACTSPD_10395 [Promethearchaeota archaeon]
MNKPEIWKDMPNNKHTWAFYFFCKRQGDKVWFKKHDGLIDIYVIKKGDNNVRTNKQ